MTTKRKRGESESAYRRRLQSEGYSASVIDQQIMAINFAVADSGCANSGYSSSYDSGGYSSGGDSGGGGSCGGGGGE